ncbi:MAG: class I SAM-dependent methyltransferase [Pseudomonadota bacterium]|nr:class I SAM-dependent methyltransferase [Pseudomonadota bacterium]
MIPLVEAPIEQYCREHSTAPSALLQELEAYTIAHCAQSQMLTGPVEGALLRLLVQLTGARRILELGMFTGYSALSMAEALPADGKILSCDVDPQTTAIARSFFDRSPHGGKIEIRLGPALDTLAALESGREFDLVFMDADKENYIAYYDAVLPRLRPGGLVIADNVLWSGAVLHPQQQSDHAIVAFNAHVQLDPRVENVMLSVRDGVMLARKR